MFSRARKIFFKEINTFIQQGCLYNVTKQLCFKFIKES